ncbi:bifunctional tRNA-dihydrouridine synthase [Babesia duncani]|uniref:tRNA-dihydrouridine synthase n=1 Tax=Babesia duncani TaxID=323732 RepID=A0AAD9UPU4_9APIC|nr:bifunctional tRNA-dihydrouridine synthase [Babesia duncani]
MVNQSELPFRLLCRRYKTDLAVTPMLHSRLFASCEKYRLSNFQTCELDQPLIAQFCSNDPITLVDAVKHVKQQVAAIDLNLGCPQAIAKTGRYGAYLLDDPDLVQEMIRRVTTELNVAVTCKMRKIDRDDLQSTIRFCLGIQQSGCKAITLHGRHKSEKGQLIGHADWDAIKLVKARLDIPVIANGGIETLDDVERCMAYTGADAVMSSEAILERPDLFSGLENDALALYSEYLDICLEYPTSISCMRAHAFKMLHKYLDVHNDVRQALVIAETLQDFFKVHEQLKILIHDTIDDSSYSNTWYRRHRKLKATVI